VRASALTLVLADLVAAVVVGAVYGVEAALITAAILAATGGAALAVAHLVAARRGRLGPLRRQFAFAIAIACGQVLVGLGVAAWLMFVSPHDALIVAVIAAFVAVIAVRATGLFAREVMDDVEAVRDGLAAVGAGDRDVVVHTGARDELAELADAANMMQQRLATEEEARRALVAAVSHDLRTPITSLMLLVEAMQDEVVDEATRTVYLERMGPHLRALSGLIDDLFELSRLESGDITWELERVRLDQLVGETVGAMRPQADAKGVVMRAEVPAELGLARANPEKVQRVLFNLIQNAIRHTPADGSVTVRAERNGTSVELEVADTGEGIAAAEREHVFDPFFRGGTETARTRAGAGLGLAISRAIVEAHGGRIWLGDAPRGTSVRFSLPTAA
jgi:signal transduction histidine kinase